MHLHERAQAMAQFAAQHPINPPPPSPCRSRKLSPEEEEQRQEEVNSRVSRPEVAQTQEQYPPQSRPPTTPSHQGEWMTPIWHLPSLPHVAAHSPLQFWRKHFQQALKYPTSQNTTEQVTAQEHLDKFYAKIDWYDLSDAAYCKVFRTTLSKRALAWFNQLPAGTISSLEQLTQRFLHHFSMNKRVPKTAAFLFTIRKRENEPLRDYMQRFVEAVHEVPHVNHELLASIIQQNLSPGRFKESIAGKPPSTMENLLMRSQKYIRIEESNASDPSLALREKAERKKEPKKKRRTGHTTEECHHLMNEIEKLIQRGYLKEYINQGPRGPTEGDSANARKALARATMENHWQSPIQVYNVNSKNQEEISFNSQDMDPMRNQNNDALVISATLANFLVKKVLVDSGSLADIMFYDAYVQLGIDNAQLRNVSTPLTGFSGELIEPLGEVMLPLSLGSLPKRSTKMVKFLVVKAPSAYNHLGETEFKPFSSYSLHLPHENKVPHFCWRGRGCGR
ncbi:UNVERIFIED_CONTAM: hypothetical protein Scaly_0787300 [Sesamum calycinum]|uniref:Retrotransposon gag domain-containing protein n=1 Tax=Sesamum calycinum TaxID=2727403 RepID=A0AAW2R971_9LAMI